MNRDNKGKPRMLSGQPERGLNGFPRIDTIKAARIAEGKMKNKNNRGKTQKNAEGRGKNMLTIDGIGINKDNILLSDIRSLRHSAVGEPVEPTDKLPKTQHNPRTSAIIRSFLILLFLSCAFALFGQADSRYDSGLNLPFNEKAGDVNPQTGNITLSYTDVALPGRAGFNFSFSRIWALNQSNVFAMNRSTINGSNYLSSETIEKYNHLGAGWNSDIPYIFIDTSSTFVVKDLFFGGNVYELVNDDALRVDSPDRSNISGYDLTDLRVVYEGTAGTAISYADFDNGSIPGGHSVTDIASDRSAYVLILKDNSKYYFRPDGRLMLHQDKTGKNKIWYFYNEYETGKDRLVLVVDSIGREISFAYTPEGNLSSITWQVTTGKKNTDGTRVYTSEPRSVHYSYVNGEQAFSDISALAGGVDNKRTPYVLTSVSDVKENVTKYDYEAGIARFSFNSAVSTAGNVYLLLTTVTDKYTELGFKNKRNFEYAIPARGLYSHQFYQGFMEYYKISRQYMNDRHNRVMNDTSYIYYEPGENGNYNQYSTTVQTGNITSSYKYSLSSLASQDNVLDTLTTRTADGFLQVTDFVYTNERTKKLDEVFRNGRWVYSEKYDYDTKGNLKRHEDRNGLVTTWQYDSVFSIPIEEVKTLRVDRVSTDYRNTTTINTIGHVTDQYIYLKKNTETIHAAHLEYDTYGNVTSQTDAKNNIVHTEYDSMFHAFPVKTWQQVEIASWPNGTIADNWKTPPTITSLMNIRNWKVFNTDGTVWIEVDNEGYAIEHYYDKLGRERETVNPNGDDDPAFPTGTDYTDIYTEYLSAHKDAYFQKRLTNPGLRVEIDDQADFIKTYADIDKDQGSVKITGKQGDGLGNVEREIEYNGSVEYSVKQMTYDNLGRMIALTDPDAGGSPTGIIVHNTTVEKYDKTWIVKYDDLGRKKRTIYPETSAGKIDIKEMSYDDLANTITTKDPDGRSVVETRDWNGNVTILKALGNSQTPVAEQQTYSYQYDELNRKIRFTDPQGIITKYSYDERNLLVKQDYGTGSDLMEYNELGQLMKMTDRKSQLITFDYDEMGRNTKVTHYKSTADFTNNVIDHTVETVYDFRGNAVRIDNQNLIEYYVYDYANRVVSLNRRLKDQTTRTAVAGIWGGDQSAQSFSFAYQYNDAGMVKKMTYPDGSEHNFAYDTALGRLANIKDGTADFVNSFTYTKSGVVTRMNYANSTYQEWQFDNRKRISNIKVTGPADVIEDLKYTLNGSGDILAINDNEYAYDGFDRISYAKTLIPGNADVSKLIEASFGTTMNKDPIMVEGKTRTYDPKADLNHDGRINGVDHAEACFIDKDALYDIESFSYDTNGNRTKLTQNGDEYRYEYGIQNRLVKVSKKKKGETTVRVFAEYTYDANGNTTKRTIYPDTGAAKIIDFEYDTMNRLVKTTEGTKVSEYFYDNAGNRFIKKDADGTTIYLRHGQIAVAMDIEVNAVQTTDKGKINRYVLSGDLLAGRVTVTVKADNSKVTAKSWYHLDHLNSTKVVTDGSGAVEVRYVYRAFGEQLKRLDASGASTDDKAKFSYGGKELDDETNLYYFNARYYDATTGRFINVDPVQDGSNWYVYCENNSLSFKDPTGLDKILTTYTYSFDKKQAETVGYNIMRYYTSLENPDIGKALSGFAKTEYLKQIIGTWAGKFIGIGTKVIGVLAEDAEKEKKLAIMNSGMEFLWTKDNYLKEGNKINVTIHQTEYVDKNMKYINKDEREQVSYNVMLNVINSKGKIIKSIELSHSKVIMDMINGEGKLEKEKKEILRDDPIDATNDWLKEKGYSISEKK